MQPDQSAAPTPAPNYDFILGPDQKPKRVIGGGIAGNSFIIKLVVIIGGAVLLMIVGALVVNLLFGDKTKLGDIISLTATEQELIRISTEGKEANDQPIRNAAMNTQLSVKSHQQDWFSFLALYGQKVAPEQLVLKKNAATDKRLASAKQTSTFDPTYTTVMRSQLETYAAAIKTAYNGATSKTERDLLDTQYTDVRLLLEQWPQ